MDVNNSLLAHQVAVVEELSRFYEQVFVITGVNAVENPSKNIVIKSTNWQKGSSFRNLWNLYKTFLQLLPKTLNSTYFFHMTDVQAALLSPILRILRIRNYLWYAHKHYSKYLWWSNIWLTGIITSTSGSCPISSYKVFPIGQGIHVAPFDYHNGTKLETAVHIGRIDLSKNYETIIDAFLAISDNSELMKLILYGEPSRIESVKYLDFLEEKYSKEIAAGIVKFAGKIDRGSVPYALSESDFFIHAYAGSLDKSLIEATLSKIPVITLNQEYISEFGRWSHASLQLTLENEFKALSELTLNERQNILAQRLNWAISNHSFAMWMAKLIEILDGHTNPGSLRHNS